MVDCVTTFSYSHAYMRAYRVQRYEKSRAKQKNPFFFLPRRSIFAIFDGKVTKKRAKYKRKIFFLFISE